MIDLVLSVAINLYSYTNQTNLTCYGPGNGFNDVTADGTTFDPWNKPILAALDPARRRGIRLGDKIAIQYKNRKPVYFVVRDVGFGQDADNDGIADDTELFDATPALISKLLGRPYSKKECLSSRLPIKWRVVSK